MSDGGDERLARPALRDQGRRQGDARGGLGLHGVADEIRRHFAGKVFETVVPRNIRLAEAPSHGLPIFQYDIKSRGAEAYLALAREVLRRAA